MDARRIVVSVGLDRLSHEIVAAALASWGWHMLDVEVGHSLPLDAAEIVLVAASGKVDAIIDRVRSARAQFPSARVVLLGAECSDMELVQLIEAGVTAHVDSNDSLVEMIDVLEMVRNNCTPTSGRITQMVLGTIRERSREIVNAETAQLTSREKQILELIGNGLSNKEIAAQLSIAANTVKNHVHHLLEKLKVRNRHEAAWLEARPPHGVSRVPRTRAEPKASGF